MSVQHLSHWGWITSHKCANLSRKLITEMSKQYPKTTWCRLCCRKLGTSHDVERTNYNLCKENVKNTGLVSAKTIDFLEKSALKIPVKLAFFYRLFFSEVCRINSRKIPLKSGGVFTNLSLKILQNLTFFSVTYMYQKPCLSWILQFNRPNTISACALSDCLKQHSKTVQYM